MSSNNAMLGRLRRPFAGSARQMPRCPFDVRPTEETAMDGPETTRPTGDASGMPTAVMFIGGFVIAGAVEGAIPLPPVPGGALRRAELGASCLMLAGGAALYLSAIGSLRRAHTAVLPGGVATHFVTTGPNRFSRNPAHVGWAVVYRGVAAALNCGWPLLLLPAILVGQTRFVIQAEERHIREMFGDGCTASCRRVLTPSGRE
jgi:protein-S-isoprenylcysteine O-methyltransferase Ste14